MSPVAKNLLVVEDDLEWCDSYVRAANREGFDAIQIAQSLGQAELFISKIQFAVAFIDIGLNVTDDQNIDGIRVMEKIRGSGDQTSIVVVTGRSGRDVLPITRDAIKKFGALDIVGKADIKPQEIRKLLQDGLAAFKKETVAEGVTAEDVLRGNTPQEYWDDQMLRATDARDGVRGLHSFLDGLLGEFLPLIAPDEDDAIILDSANGLAHGIYWSRAVGRAVAVLYGRRSVAEELVEGAKSSGLLLGRHNVGSQLGRSSAHGLTGAVFALKDTPRDAFSDLG